jgi:S-formylglutathione hydrolase FrmB
MKTLPYDYEYREWEGSHNWDFFASSLEPAIEFFNNVPGP